MRRQVLFSHKTALQLTLAVTFLALALLVSAPIRIHAIIALLLIYSIGFLVVNRQKLVMTRQDWLVLLILSLYMASHLPVFVISGYSSRYLAPGLHMMGIIPIYLMLRMALHDLDLKRFRAALEYGGFAGSLGGAGIAVYEVYVLGQAKVDAFLFHINFGYLSASLFFLLVALLPSSQRRALVSAGALLALLATLLSTSRGAVFAIPIVFTVLLVWQWRRIGAVYLVAALLGLGVLAIASYFSLPQVEDRIDVTVSEVERMLEGDFRDNSAGGRVRLWAAAIEAFKERPLVGLTYEERDSLNEELAGTGIINAWVTTISRGHAHSQYFETLATGGLIGVVALFFYLVFPALHFFIRSRREPENPYCFVGFVFSLGFIVFCLSEVPLQHEMIATYYAFVLVLLFILTSRHTESVA
ncbi:O-antigen ligase family protein [Halomonas sp. A29]|uniref:O-antigen ligase family protein n=1 Tax=Halomonas sp. A29 TaxID=3102786 RepID=UPI00398B2976